MRTISFINILILGGLFGCHSVKEKAEETINTGGKIVGNTATEFISGVSEGVDNTLQCQIILSDELHQAGLRTGTFSIRQDSTGSNKNLLTLYVIFDNAVVRDLIVKAFDKNDLEIGRSKLKVEGNAGEAKYYDIQFDRRTDIGTKSKVLIQ